MEDDPAAPPDDPSVVDVARVTRPGGLVLDRRRRGRPARDRSAEEQRGVEAGVDESGEQPDPGQPSGRPEDGVVGSSRPLGERQTAERLLDQPQEQRLAGRGDLAGERRGIELAPRDEQPGVTGGGPHEEVAFGQVRLDGGREEQLPLGVLDHRLVGAQELEIGRHSPSAPRGVAARSAGSSRPNTARTAGWLR